MGFRDEKVDKVIIVENSNKQNFIKELLIIVKDFKVVDLQYSTATNKDDTTTYSAILLVQ